MRRTVAHVMSPARHCHCPLTPGLIGHLHYRLNFDLDKSFITGVDKRRTDDGRRTADGGRRTADDGRRTTDGGRWTADSGRRTTDGGPRSIL